MNTPRTREAYKPPVTLKAVAEHLGLSSGTVSVVLNRAPTAIAIPQQTQDRIFAAARELDYRPNPIARALRNRQGTGARAAMPQDLRKPSGALMFMAADHLRRAILAIREAGLRVPEDVPVVGSESPRTQDPSA